MMRPSQLAQARGPGGRDRRRPILVTGAPRSGTTFLGTMLSLNRDVSYIYEPLSRTHGLRGVPAPMLYVRRGSRDEALAQRMTHQLLLGRASFRRPPPEFGSSSLPRTVARRVLGTQVSLRYRRDSLNPLRRRWLLKDPWAAFASEWLHQQIGMQTIVIVRHPVPTVSSYRRLGWDMRIAEFASMDELVADHLGELLDGVDIASLDALENAALVWRAFYFVLGRYLDRNPEMIAVRHEDLSADPLGVLAGLYERLGLHFDDRARERVAAYTAADNEVEVDAGVLHQLRRDSAAVATSWRSKVDPREVDTIRRWTEPEASRWYSDRDW